VRKVGLESAIFCVWFHREQLRDEGFGRKRV